MDFVDPACIEFSDKAAAKYVCGGWLGEYVNIVLTRCAPPAHDTDVEVTHEGTRGVNNQFDGLALHRNRMLFIKAKAARMDEEKKNKRS